MAALLLPCLAVISCGSPLWNVAGIFYVVLLGRLSSTMRGRRFIRAYYREILRLENLL